MLAVLVGCATQPTVDAAAQDASVYGQVAARSIDKLVEPTQRLQLAANESFEMPLAERGNALPRYPEALLARRLPPQAVCLNVAIDASGAVSGSSPLTQPPRCAGPDAIDPAFYEAAAQAVRQWRFDPAFRCVYPGTKPVGEQGCVTGREVPQAISLAYLFVFEQRDGRGVVRLGD